MSLEIGLAPSCAACGKKLRRARQYNLSPVQVLLSPRLTKSRRLRVESTAGCTADGQPVTWGAYGDNLVCGLRCGWLLAVRLVASMGMTREQVREALPPAWRPEVKVEPARHNHPTKVVLPPGKCPACDAGRSGKPARRSLASEGIEQLHEECLDCDALILTHRAGKTHCRCGGDWPCQSNAAARTFQRGTCTCCGARRKISGHLNREVCQICRAQGMAGWSLDRMRRYRQEPRAYKAARNVVLTLTENNLKSWLDLDQDQGP